MKKFIIMAGVALAMVFTTTAYADYNHSVTLRAGMSGTQVLDLQNCLNTLGHSVGYADSAFGGMTAAGVRSFQAASSLYTDGVVGPMTGAAVSAACNGTTGGDVTYTEGCTSAVGFSPLTGDKCEVLGGSSSDLPEGCTSTTGFSPLTGDKCDGSGSSSTSFDSNDGEEVNFTGLDIDDAADTTIDEGTNKAELASIDFKNEDSDVLLERMDIILVSDLENAADETDAWKVFDKLYIYVDGDMVASMDSDDKSDWDDRTVAYNSEDKDNRFRFTGINEVLDMDEDHTVTIKADIATSVDMDTVNGAQWVLVLDETTMRFVDEAGITSYLSEADTNLESTANFAIVAEGDQDELQVKSSNDDPDSTTFEVKSGQESDAEMLFAFDVEADQDGGDLEISEMTMEIDVTALDGAAAAAYFDSVISEVTVKIAGETEDYDVSRSTINTTGVTSTLVFDFDGKEINIDAGDKETAEVYVTFKSTNNQTAYVNGATVKLEITTLNVQAWDVDGADTLAGASQLSGSAVGDAHQLSEEGVIATLNSSSVSTTIDNNGEVKSATYTMNVELEAFGDTFYTSKTAILSAIGGTEALSFDVEDSADVVQTTLGTPSLVSFALSSSASTDGSAWRIDEGETETLTLTATVEIPTGGVDTYTRLQLNEVGVWTTNSLNAGGQIITLLPIEDYESALQLINNI